jgi:SAM-dependent methyltransferase
MTMVKCVGRFVVAAVVLLGASPAWAQEDKVFVPVSGQPGKDVVWVPSPEETVAKMMDVGQVGPQDFVIDLGSGDGRNVIAAAKRGARGLGVEYNPDMVTLSNRLAQEAGVADRAQFVQGDMFAADFSKATVLALFLLPNNLMQLRDKIYNLQPGTRVVLNTFGIQDWAPDEQVTLDSGNCSSWCTVMLNIVPAKIAGTWQVSDGSELALAQDFQMVTGTLKSADGRSQPVNGRLRGNDLTVTVGTQEYTARVDGNRLVSGTLTATKVN